MNELIESWEAEAGVDEFVVLTAQADDAHLEALSTIRTDHATVQVMDILGMDFGNLLHDTRLRHRMRELEGSLLLHLAPDLVGPELATASSSDPTVSAPKGTELYRFILDRISTCLDRA